MRRSYSGNVRPFAVVLYTQEDREKVLPVLEAVSKAGKELCYGKAKIKKKVIKKASAVVVFITDAFSKDRELQNTVLKARSMERPIIPVIMSKEGLPEILRPFLAAANAIMTEQDQDEESIANKILEAESMQMRSVTKAQSVAMERTTRTLVVSTVLVVLAALLIIIQPWKLIADSTQETSAPITTPAEMEQEHDPRTAETDLERIRIAVFAGDAFLQTYEKKIVENRNKEGYWYSWAKDTDGNGGERIWKGGLSQSDFNIISRMTNLHTLIIVEQNITKLPDLSNLNQLMKIVIWNTPIDDISSLGECKKLKELDIRQTWISDLSVLTECNNLEKLYFRDNPVAEECNLEKLTYLMPKRLESASFHHCHKLNKVNGCLAECKRLKELELSDTEIASLSFLRDLTGLESVRLSNLANVSDLSSLRGIKLKRIFLDNLPQLTDVSFLKNTDSLLEFEARNCEKLNDVSALSNKNALTNITLENTKVNNVSFLKGVSNSRRLSLSISGDIDNWSGLKFVDSFLKLELDSGNTDINKAISSVSGDTVIASLTLRNCTDLNLKKIPANTVTLELDNTDITSLEGIGHVENMRSLVLRNNLGLSSLNGIRDCGMLTGITVDNCPGLTDVEALYTEGTGGRTWQYFEWCNMRELTPDLEKMNFVENAILKFSGIFTLKDFSFLKKIPEGKRQAHDSYWFEFGGLDSIRDFSALVGNKGYRVVCPEHTPDEIVEELKSSFVEVYRKWPTKNGEESSIEVMPESLEELESMPASLLKYVTEFVLVGDTVLPDGYGWHTEWSDGKARYLIDDPETGESKETGDGVMTDLSLLDKLIGLQKLILINQPLKSLEGIQRFQNLQEVYLCGCTSLADISSVFGIPSLEWIDVSNTQVGSLQGIQNLTKLRGIGLENTRVRDLMPLSECDFTYASEKCGGLDLNISGLSVNSIMPLLKISKFGVLRADLINWDKLKETESWDIVLKNHEVRGIGINIDGNEELDKLLRQHPELEELHIQGNDRITDLTPVLDMPNLRYIKMSPDQSEAIDSIQGKFKGKLDIVS